MKFSLGQIVATPGALAVLNDAGVNPTTLIVRHSKGDWGSVHREDAAANEAALIHGARILSVYVINGIRVWVLTEAEDDAGVRNSTCILLPSEY